MPEVAIGTDQNERFLLIVGKDDVVATRPVKLGSLFGSLRSIVSGLHPGDRVVVNGLQMARPGSKVDPAGSADPGRALCSALASSDSGADAQPLRVSVPKQQGRRSEHRAFLHRPARSSPRSSPS